MATDKKEDGTPITDELVEVMADEVEAGYDVDEIIRRRGGRPAMGAAPASVESVRLYPELKRELIVHPAEEHISVSEPSGGPFASNSTQADARTFGAIGDGADSGGLIRGIADSSAGPGWRAVDLSSARASVLL